MAKKKSAGELKEEGVTLGEQITLARKRVLNFALQIGKDGLVLETDVKKNCEVLWRNCKKNGGGPKGAMGTMNVSGKVIELHCVDDSAPNQLPKLAKKWLSERGQMYKVVMITPSGTIGDEDEEETEADNDAHDISTGAEEETEEAPPTAGLSDEEAMSARPSDLYPGDPERAALLQTYQDMSDRLQQAAQSLHSGAAKKTEKLSETFLKQVEQNPSKAHSLLKMLQKTADDAIAFGIVSASPNAQEDVLQREESQAVETSLTEPTSDELGSKISSLRNRIDRLLEELA